MKRNALLSGRSTGLVFLDILKISNSVVFLKHKLSNILLLVKTPLFTICFVLHKMASNHTSMPPFELAHETQATWTLVQENFFIDQMVEAVTARGDHRSMGVFSKDEWTTIRKAYYERFRLNHSKKSFKNKMNNLKDRFKDFKKLVEKNTGLGWDYVLCTVDATPIWWDKYLKENPRMKRFRTQGCPEYKKLEIIFGDTIATGQIQASQGHNFDSSDDEIETETFPATQFSSRDASEPSTSSTAAGGGNAEQRRREMGAFRDEICRRMALYYRMPM